MVAHLASRGYPEILAMSAGEHSRLRARALSRRLLPARAPSLFQTTAPCPGAKLKPIGASTGEELIGPSLALPNTGKRELGPPARHTF